MRCLRNLLFCGILCATAGCHVGASFSVKTPEGGGVVASVGKAPEIPTPNNSVPNPTVPKVAAAPADAIRMLEPSKNVPATDVPPPSTLHQSLPPQPPRTHSSPVGTWKGGSVGDTTGGSAMELVLTDDHKGHAKMPVFGNCPLIWSDGDEDTVMITIDLNGEKPYAPNLKPMPVRSQTYTMDAAGKTLTVAPIYVSPKYSTRPVVLTRQ